MASDYTMHACWEAIVMQCCFVAAYVIFEAGSALSCAADVRSPRRSPAPGLPCSDGRFSCPPRAASFVCALSRVRGCPELAASACPGVTRHWGFTPLFLFAAGRFVRAACVFFWWGAFLFPLCGVPGGSGVSCFRA